ncbi:hypothetical protein BGZ61DRAFT_376678, partial [Ilyonectria robusta]|uniref:uncharacterized protein n=1 Tax=Ilyonectria robusta TaxID=1079257 RepID=UPI001E8CA577
PAWNPQNTRPRAQKAKITYLPFLNLIAFPLRTISLIPSWQSCREMYKPNRPLRSGATATKQAYRNIADHDLSKEKEKAIGELHKENIQEHLAPVVRNSPVQKSDTGSYRQIFIYSLDEVIMHTEAEVAQPSTRSPSGLAVFLPPVEYDWDKILPSPVSHPH